MNPLRIIHVGFTPWHRASISGIGKYYMKSVRFEYLVNRNPIDAGRLHGDCRDAEAHQPVSHPLKISGEGIKGLNRILREISWNDDNMKA